MSVELHAEWWEVLLLLVVGGFGWGLGDGMGRWLYESLFKKGKR